MSITQKNLLNLFKSSEQSSINVFFVGRQKHLQHSVNCNNDKCYQNSALPSQATLASHTKVDLGLINKLECFSKI